MARTPCSVAAPGRVGLVGGVHLFLLDRGADRVLLLRRAGTGYEDGCFSVPAGHIEAGEPATGAMIREAREEIGVSVKPGDVRVAHVMHRRSVKTDCRDSERVDFFFRAYRWTGTPRNREPQKHDSLLWADVTRLPPTMVLYVRDALGSYLRGCFYSESGWGVPCPACGSTGRMSSGLATSSR